MELRVKRQDGSKIVPYFHFSQCAQGTYITPLQIEHEIILKQLVVVEQLVAKAWLSAISNETWDQKHMKLLHLLQF